jgi:hypothetical protein
VRSTKNCFIEARGVLWCAERERRLLVWPVQDLDNT